MTMPNVTHCNPLLPVDHLDEGKSDTSSQPPVGHDELLLQVDLLQTEPVLQKEEKGQTKYKANF